MAGSWTIGVYRRWVHLRWLKGKTADFIINHLCDFLDRTSRRINHDINLVLRHQLVLMLPNVRLLGNGRSPTLHQLSLARCMAALQSLL